MFIKMTLERARELGLRPVGKLPKKHGQKPKPQQPATDRQTMAIRALRCDYFYCQ